MRSQFATLPVIALLGAAGCGNVTSGGVGEVEVVLVADSLPAAEPSLFSSVGAIMSGASGPTVVLDTLRIEGTLTVHLRTFIRREGTRDWIELTDGPQAIALPLQGGELQVIARGTVPAGRYLGARTRFGRVEAEIVRGLEIDGEPIEGTVEVRLGPEGGIELVEPDLLLTVSEDRSLSLAIEMNSRIWLRLVDRALRRVEEGDFRGAVRIRLFPRQ